VSALPVLTIQQLRVVLQLAGGRGYKPAAFALGISIHTVRLHVIRIAAKLEGTGSPKDKVLCHADRLIAAQSIELLAQARDKVAA
jgi:DNA-binding NarL/FixJ family response regulator